MQQHSLLLSKLLPQATRVYSCMLQFHANRLHWMMAYFDYSLLLTALTCALLCSSAHGEGSGCSGGDQDLENERVTSLLQNIQAQLGGINGSDPDNKTSPDPHEIDPSVLEMYYVLKNSTDNSEPLPELGHEGSCYDGAFYAKPVTSFLGTMMPADLPDGQGVLGAYMVHLNFTLDSQLTDVSRADLLLYQEPTMTGPLQQPRDYQQYVEIRTIVDGTQGLERHVVEGKYIETFKDGYQVFDVSKAVNQWQADNMRGNVTLEVIVFCYSSPECADTDRDGRGPAIVRFLYYTSDSAKAPRVIIVSTNPLEDETLPASSRVSKRAASTGLKFCEDDEELCCLKPLTINFRRDLRESRVVWPPSFEAHYCQGICPGVQGSKVLSTQRYAFLRHLGLNHPAATLEPCCAGARYENEDVIMKVYNRASRRFETQIIKLQQVRVTACRCG